MPVRSVFQTGSGVPAWRTSRRSLRGLAVVRHCCRSRTFSAGLAGLAPVLLPSGGLPGWIGLPAWRAVVAVSTRRAVVQSCSLAGISCCASCGRASCWSCVRVLPPSAWPFRSGSEDSGPGAPRGGLCCPASRPPGAFHTGSGIRLARPTAVLRSRWCPASRGLPGWLGSLRPGAPSRRLVRSCSSCWSCCAVLLSCSFGCCIAGRPTGVTGPADLFLSRPPGAFHDRSGFGRACRVGGPADRAGPARVACRGAPYLRSVRVTTMRRATPAPMTDVSWTSRRKFPPTLRPPGASAQRRGDGSPAPCRSWWDGSDVRTMGRSAA